MNKAYNYSFLLTNIRFFVTTKKKVCYIQGKRVKTLFAQFIKLSFQLLKFIKFIK